MDHPPNRRASSFALVRKQSNQDFGGAIVDDEYTSLPTPEEWRETVCHKHLVQIVYINMGIIAAWMFLTVTQLQYREIVQDSEDAEKLGWPEVPERWRFAAVCFSMVLNTLTIPTIHRSLRKVIMLIIVMEIFTIVASIGSFAYDVEVVHSVCDRILLYTGTCWRPQYYLTCIFDIVYPIAVMHINVLLVLYLLKRDMALVWYFRGKVRLPQDHFHSDAPYICEGCGMLVRLEDSDLHGDLFCPKPVHCKFCNLQILYCDIAPELGRSDAVVDGAQNPLMIQSQSPITIKQTEPLDQTDEISTKQRELLRRALVRHQRHCPECPRPLKPTATSAPTSNSSASGTSL